MSPHSNLTRPIASCAISDKAPQRHIETKSSLLNNTSNSDLPYHSGTLRMSLPSELITLL